MIASGYPTGHYSMGITCGIFLKVLVDCSWNQSRNTVEILVLWEVVGDEPGGLAYRAHSISSPLVRIRDQLITTSTHHLHTVCCSEARAPRLGCWEHIILRITDLFQQSIHINSQYLLIAKPIVNNNQYLSTANTWCMLPMNYTPTVGRFARGFCARWWRTNVCRKKKQYT